MLMLGCAYVLHPADPRRGLELEDGRRIARTRPAIAVVRVQVIVTGTAPDWSEKKITPDGPALMSPGGGSR